MGNKFYMLIVACQMQRYGKAIFSPTLHLKILNSVSLIFLQNYCL